MYPFLNFFIYILALLITLFLLCDGQKRRAIFHAEVSAAMQAVYGVLLAAGLVAALGALNVAIYGKFSVLFFLAADAKTMANFLIFQLLVAVTEEAFFRGYLTELGKKYRVPRPALVLLTAVLFGLLHLMTNRTLVQFFIPAIIGAVFEACYVYDRRCTIWSVMLAHFLYDICIVAVPPA